MRRPLSSLTFLLAAQLLAACGIPTEEEQLTSQDEVIQAEGPLQALSDTCTDSRVSLAQPDGAAVNLYYPNCGYANSAATSNDSSYDQPLCTNKFVTEVRQVNGRWFSAFVEAIPATTDITESACKGIAITGSAWGYNGTWVPLGNLSTTGVWHPASCNPLFCLPASCQLRFEFATAYGGYSKVRVAGFAAALGIFKGRVRTGVYSGGGPC